MTTQLFSFYIVLILKCILVRSSHVLSHYHKACQISVTSWQLSCLLHPGDWFRCRLISRGQRLASGQLRRAPNNSLGLWVTAAITAGLACTASAVSQVKRGQTQRGRRMIKLFKLGKLLFQRKTRGWKYKQAHSWHLFSFSTFTRDMNKSKKKFTTILENQFEKCYCHVKLQKKILKLKVAQVVSKSSWHFLLPLKCVK